MNPFNNPQIDVLNLPSFESLDFIPLETSYRTVILAKSILFWIVVVVGAACFLYFKEPTQNEFIIKSMFGLILFLFIIRFISILIGFKLKSYSVREHDIQYKTGWLWRSHTIIPFKRIQHSEVSQGPIERLFNLGRLRVFTAGGSSSDLVIPGLTHEHANRLKMLITSRISSNEEE